MNNNYWWRTEINQIEKMYENAELLYCNKCRHDSEIDCIYMCESKYPPFTAEKQIELIKWLAEFSDFGTFSPDAEIDKDTKIKIYGFAFVKREEAHYYVDDKFEIALAKCFNNLWQDLTEEEHKQIQEILK